ncbi:MAG: M1 family metallopeptidase, partial [Bacteroidales bacterium]|nr:M1 family metallopeptidase [Bacteroidales bacterium]
MKHAFSKIIIVSVLLFTLVGCIPEKPLPNPSSQVDAWFTQWDDLSVYSSGLISTEQETLKELPGATIYHIDLVITDDLASLTGFETIKYTNRETTPLDSIAFQLYPNQLGGSAVVSNVRVNEQPAETNYLEGNSAVIVKLTASLQPGESVLVSMDFSVDLPTTGGGNYGIFGFIDNILVLDGFYPGIPVYNKAGWHAGPLPPNADTTFNDASFYLVRVKAPANLVLVTSGLEMDKSIKGDQLGTTFAAGPARDFYIAGSTQFTKVSKAIGETVVNSYSLPDYQKGAEIALTTSIEALQDFSTRYGAYPYTEFDVVSTPMQGATGIEYPGVVGINKLIYDPNQTISGVSAFAMLETTVAHEVGHQWFY